jgi:hypothetical protein
MHTNLRYPSPRSSYDWKIAQDWLGHVSLQYPREIYGGTVLSVEIRGMNFVSKLYPDIIRDQCSYEAWLEWKAERPAEERVLWVVG